MKNLATLYFFGTISPIPGTVGSLIGILVGLLFISYSSSIYFLYFLIAVFFVSYFSVREYTLDPNEHGHDPKEVIIDELLGQLIAMTPIFFLETDTKSIIIISFTSFLLFRFFDIVKPWPISYFDNIKNPLGVILDDIVAGIISALILYFILTNFL